MSGYTFALTTHLQSTTPSQVVSWIKLFFRVLISVSDFICESVGTRDSSPQYSSPSTPSHSLCCRTYWFVFNSLDVCGFGKNNFYLDNKTTNFGNDLSRD